MSTESFHNRINDHPLSFGLVRFTAGSGEEQTKLWRLIVSRWTGRQQLESIDIDVSDLIAIKAFCDKAIECLQTDGGRLPTVEDAS